MDLFGVGGSELLVLLFLAGVLLGPRRPARPSAGAAPQGEIDDAFRRGGAAAVSGCGMLPGWTDLLGAHFLPGGTVAGAGEADRKTLRFLFCSPDRFGGYAFFRRIVREAGPPAAAPPRASRGAF